MSNKEKIVYPFLIMIAAAGVYLGSYAGGFLTGGSVILLVVMVVGKHLASKAINRIDKRVKDIIVDNQN